MVRIVLILCALGWIGCDTSGGGNKAVELDCRNAGQECGLGFVCRDNPDGVFQCTADDDAGDSGSEGGDATAGDAQVEAPDAVLVDATLVDATLVDASLVDMGIDDMGIADGGADDSATMEPFTCSVEARSNRGAEWEAYADGERPLRATTLDAVELRGQIFPQSDDAIIEYEWIIVEEPEGSLGALVPHSAVPDPTFHLTISGRYVFELRVTDTSRDSEAEPCRVFVEAVPTEDISIELVWDTPGDADPTDAAGSDLDLHFLHPRGQWFCPPWDVFWLNHEPDWAAVNQGDDDPSLDLDDTDGVGPEIINLDNPENVDYRIGVYYFTDRGFGPSFATVRIYIGGMLHFEATDKELAVADMFWDVATLSWPSGEITLIDELLLTPPDADCP